MKRVVKFTATLVLLPALVSVATWVAYLHYSMISREVLSGTAYGLSVGMSKRDVFERLPVVFHLVEGGEGWGLVQRSFTRDLQHEFKSEFHGLEEMRLFELNSGLLVELTKVDQWEFYFGHARSDLIRLTFCDETLCKIYRFRKHYELP